MSNAHPSPLPFVEGSFSFKPAEWFSQHAEGFKLRAPMESGVGQFGLPGGGFHRARAFASAIRAAIRSWSGVMAPHGIRGPEKAHVRFMGDSGRKA